MDKFIVGFFVSLLLFVMIILFTMLGRGGESADIANQCKAYGLATIDKKVYNCTLREVK